MHGDSSAISRWASNLEVPGDEVTYFNFLASHDGIGINPVRGIIEEEKILEMVKNLEKEGALVSYKKNTDGSLSPYEINSSYINAVSKKNDTDEIKTGKFLNAQAVLLAFKGVPAIYVHSILGSENYYKGVKITGMNRTINREKLEYGKITSELENKNGIRSRIYNRLKELIKARKAEKAFNPDAEQIIQNYGSEVFSFVRISVDKEEKILVINNISDKEVTLKIPYEIKRTVTAENSLTDKNHVRLAPYGFIWLEIK